MAQVDKTVLVEYACDRMFSLVRDVGQYPRFLPWCSSASVEAMQGPVTRATLNIDYHGVRTSFSTENVHEPPRSIEIRLLQGPFRQLQGSWRFAPLGESACKIQLCLSYEFSSRLLEKLFGPVFNYIANSLVDAFVRRAEQLYGRR
jgi:ribosome-associated toxin RatA of RatAB toxin-antitoxin module